MNFVSKLLQGLAYIPSVVTGIESLLGGRGGGDKKGAALSFMEAALATAEGIADHQIVDEAKFKEGLGMVIDGTVQCLNASLWAKPTPPANQ
jgi:hypothetical protein